MVKFQSAKYTPSKNSDFSGNPYIEALPNRLAPEEFWHAVVNEVELPKNMADLDLETLEQKSSNIMHSVLPTSQYYEIYCDFLNVLKVGYQDRNPMSEETQKSKHQVATSSHQTFRTTAPSLNYTGYSGMGKTTLINSVLSLIPPVIDHPAGGPLNKADLQIVYIKVDIPGNANSHSICLIIAGEIDKILGTDYRLQYEKLTHNICVQRLVTLCSTLLVGAIIFDELHNICFSSPNERKHIFTLFDQLTQVARIPTIKIGTSKANRLPEREFTNARRLGNPHELRNFKKNDPDWKMLVEYAWEYQLLSEAVEQDSKIEDRIYLVTQGVPHCLFFLIEQLNIYCLRNAISSFSIKAIDHIFDTKFSLMKPAIIALRHGKVDAFDDLMSANVQLDKEVRSLVKKLLKIAEENKFEKEEAQAIYQQIERYLPEYQLTQKEQQTVKRLEKILASTPSNLTKDSHGYDGVPL